MGGRRRKDAAGVDGGVSGGMGKTALVSVKGVPSMEQPTQAPPVSQLCQYLESGTGAVPFVSGHLMPDH